MQHTCGTFGCILLDRHKGLHMFPFPPQRCRQPKQTPIPSAESTAPAEPDSDTESESVSTVRIGTNYQASIPAYRPNQAVTDRNDVLVSSPKDWETAVEVIDVCLIASCRKRIAHDSTTTLCGKRARVKWSAEKAVASHSTWFKGAIGDFKLIVDKEHVYYCDGNTYWEPLKACVSDVERHALHWRHSRSHRRRHCSARACKDAP